MRSYRAWNPDYRQRERAARARRRRRALLAGARQQGAGEAAEAEAGFTVTEAGLLPGSLASLYVVRTPRGRVWLRVVTADGRAVILEPAMGWGEPVRAVTEAGLGP